MRKLIFILTLLIPMVSAEEVAKVQIEAKVYKVDKLDKAVSLKELLADATLEHNPRILAEYGKEAGLQFNYQNEDDSESSVLEILVLSDQSSQTYNIDINLLNGDNENISRIYDHPIGKSFIASTVIDNASRVVQIDVSESKPVFANFILQTSNNLNCDSLAIELKGQQQEQRYYLEYAKNVFAAVSLPDGEFDFGDVICRTSEGQQVFDVLQEQLAPLEVNSGQTYYGGRLIFKAAEQSDTNKTPESLKTCMRFVSGARGPKEDNLCDGIGVASDEQNLRKIDVYMPEVTDEDIATIRQALKVNDGQLHYLPLMVKE